MSRPFLHARKRTASGFVRLLVFTLIFSLALPLPAISEAATASRSAGRDDLVLRRLQGPERAAAIAEAARQDAAARAAFADSESNAPSDRNENVAARESATAWQDTAARENVAAWQDAAARKEFAAEENARVEGTERGFKPLAGESKEEQGRSLAAADTATEQSGRPQTVPEVLFNGATSFMGMPGLEDSAGNGAAGGSAGSMGSRMESRMGSSAESDMGRGLGGNAGGVRRDGRTASGAYYTPGYGFGDDPLTGKNLRGDSASAAYHAQSSSSGINIDDPDYFSQRGLSYGTGLLNRMGEAAFTGLFDKGRARLNFMVDMDGRVNGEGDLLYPFYDGQYTTIFTQAGLRSMSGMDNNDKDGRGGDRWIGNFGLGQRWYPAATGDYDASTAANPQEAGESVGLYDAGNWMFGYNIFFDNDFTRSHQRGGVGVEAQWDWLKLASNYYFPLSSWKGSYDFNSQFVEERPAEGWDLRLKGYLPFYRNIALTGAYTQWYGDHVGMFSSTDLEKDPKVWSYGLEYTPMPLVSAYWNQRTTERGQSDSEFGLRFTYRFGMSWQDQTSHDKVADLHTVSASRHEFVERENRIILEYRAKNAFLIEYVGPGNGVNEFVFRVRDGFGAAKAGHTVRVTAPGVTLAAAPLAEKPFLARAGAFIGKLFGPSMAHAADGSQNYVTDGNGRFIVRVSSRVSGPLTLHIQAGDNGQSFTVNVMANTPSITTESLPAATVGVPYNPPRLTAENGTAPYHYAVSEGSLPAGLDLSESGVFSGTPLQAGLFTFTVRVTDASGVIDDKSFTLEVLAALSIITDSLPVATALAIYAPVSLEATGGTAPYSYALTRGNLPAGLDLNGNSIEGTPAAATNGNYPLTFTVTDASGITAEKELTLTVAEELVIITDSLPIGTVGAAYAALDHLKATGGTLPHTFSASDLPADFSLNGNSIEGSPTTAGSFLFTVRVTDASNVTAEKPLTLHVKEDLSITTASLPTATVGAAYTAPSLEAEGGTGPYSFSATGLPNDLSLNSSNGTLSGTPAAGTDGDHSITITVTDASGVTASKTLSLTIKPALVISTANLPTATVNATYSQKVEAQGGTEPYTFRATGLPAGLNLNGDRIEGTPTGAADDYSVTITVTDANNVSVNKTLTLTIKPALAISTASLPTATTGTAYTAPSLEAEGGTAPYSFSATGLPTGLSIDAGTGALSGTPAANMAGSHTVVITVTDASNVTSEKEFILTVKPALPISINSLPAAIVSVPYGHALEAEGGTAPYSYALTRGNLPAGLSLSNGSGILSGTPIAGTAGEHNFTITVTDAHGVTAGNVLTLTVTELSISTSSLPFATVGAAYTAALSASGSAAPYTYDLTRGSLPTGLNLSSGSGILSGTPAAGTAGVYNFTIVVTDGYARIVEKAFTLTVAGEDLLFTTGNPLPIATVGAPYRQAITAAGGTEPYSYEVSGNWPDGLNWHGNSLEGTPVPGSDAASPYNISFSVTDAGGQSLDQTFTLTVMPALSISTASLPAATARSPYTAALSATGGAEPYSFSASLPNGLSCDSSGTITGTLDASMAGDYPVTVRVTDASGATASKTLTLAIKPALLITNASLPDAVVGVAYGQILTATGGTTPYTFSATGLPAGLDLAADNGFITGTPNAGTAGDYSVTVTVTDKNGVTAEKNLTLHVTALAISTNSLPVATALAPYTAALSASGGAGPYSYAVTSGNLPAGLSLNSSNGTLSGTPEANAAGEHSITITVTDAKGVTAEKTFTLKVTKALSITTTSLPTATALATYSQTVAASGGTGPYSYAVTSGNLPAGLSLNSSSGVLSGTPEAGADGDYPLTITVTDANGVTAEKTFTLKVAEALVISTASPLAIATALAAYSQTLEAAGGTGSYSYALTSGSLPTGLDLSESGVLSGMPAAGTANDYPLTITVTDENNVTAEKAFTLTVKPALAISTASLPDAAVGAAYSQTLAVEGGTEPYSYTQSGNLPAGLSFSNGTLSGTPTNGAAGDYDLSITVTDANGVTANKTLTLHVTELVINTANLSIATVGVAYSQTVEAEGGTEPYGYAVTTGGLPAGLYLNGKTIAGTPDAGTAGEHNITITVTDVNGVTAEQAFTLTVAEALVIYNSGFLFLQFTVGDTYNRETQMAVSGGTAPYTFSATGLPEGLSLSNGSGVTVILSGTIAEGTVGEYPVTLTVTDANGVTATCGRTMQVRDRIVFSPDSLPVGTVGAYYGPIPVSNTGGWPVSGSIDIAGLPAGLRGVMNRIEGTPAPGTEGSHEITITARPADATGASTTLTLIIKPALVIETASLPIATVGAAYTSPSLEAEGGTDPYTFSATGLPTGLSLNGDTIEGTPAANMAGNHTVVITVTDDNNVTSEKEFILTVKPTLPISINSLPNAAVGAPYSHTLEAEGGTGPYSYALTRGSLAGLDLSENGAITGTPEASAAGEHNFTITVTDANSVTAENVLTLTVTELSISTSSLPMATASAAYSHTLAASGGTAPYRYAVTTGSLPASLDLSESGAITGTPEASAAGKHSFTVTVTDANNVTAEKKLTLTVAGEDLFFTNDNPLPNATVGVPYKQTFTAAGGTEPYSYTQSGDLPTGLSFSNGTLSGTPASGTASDYSVTITVTDANEVSVSKTLTLHVAEKPYIYIGLIEGFSVGKFFEKRVTAWGGTEPYRFSALGRLPEGVSFSNSDGVGILSGTPVAGTAGEYELTFTVEDANGVTAKDEEAILDVRVAPDIIIDSLPDATVGAYYEGPYPMDSGGWFPRVDMNILEQSLPNGLYFSRERIMGIPADGTAGSYPITITVNDLYGATASKTLPLKVAEKLVIETASLPVGTVNALYTATTLSATGGTANYTFSASDLPAGLSLNGNSIEGTPTGAAGDYTVTITVTDANNVSVNKTLTLTIKPVLVIETDRLPTGTISAIYSAVLSASGGTAPYTFSATGLPDRFTLNNNVITGRPLGSADKAGEYSVTITVTDASGVTYSRNMPLLIILYTLQADALSVITNNSPADGATANEVQVQVYDSVSQVNAGAGVTVTWSVPGVDANITLADGDTSVTDASGIARKRITDNGDITRSITVEAYVDEMDGGDNLTRSGTVQFAQTPYSLSSSVTGGTGDFSGTTHTSAKLKVQILRNGTPYAGANKTINWIVQGIDNQNPAVLHSRPTGLAWETGRPSNGSWLNTGISSDTNASGEAEIDLSDLLGERVITVRATLTTPINGQTPFADQPVTFGPGPLKYFKLLSGTYQWAKNNPMNGATNNTLSDFPAAYACGTTMTVAELESTNWGYDSRTRLPSPDQLLEIANTGIGYAAGWADGASSRYWTGDFVYTPFYMAGVEETQPSDSSLSPNAEGMDRYFSVACLR